LLDATNPNSTYQWQNGSTNPTQNVSVTGVYWVLVQNTAGCKARDTVSITFNPNPIFNLGADTSLCAGDTLTLSAAAGNATSYLWNTGATTATIKATQAGLYWCEARIGTCVFRDSLRIIAVNPRPVVNLGPDQTSCAGNIVLLDATNPNSTYLWQNGNTTPSLNVTITGVYWVQVQNAAGCVSRDTVSVTFNPSPLFNLGADTSICTGDTLTLSAAAGNATSYIWNTGATTATIKAAQAGLYWCEARIGNCIFRDSLRILAVNPSPVVNLGNDQTLCSGNSVMLNATNPNSTYLWQNGTTNATLNVTATGLYWVQVQNNFSCTRRDSVTINFKPLPVFNLGADTSICQTDVLLLNASAANASSYQWNTGAVTSSINVSSAGLFWCEATLNGCIFRDTLSVLSLKPYPLVNLGADQNVCEGNTVTLDATNNNATYLWQNGSTGAMFIVNTQGLYHVQVTLDGCKKSDSVSIAYTLKPKFTLGNDQAICPGYPIILSPVVNTNWQLRWQDGSLGSTYTVNQPGLYSLIATNNCGSGSDDINITKGYCKVIVPNAFTPNNDGLNDLFKVLGVESVTELNMKIFNRWGEMVFETNDKTQGWNGRYKNKMQQTGTFVYLLTYKETGSTKSLTQKGTFVLIQ
jgi:gliding motility-associated-like protein